ncbi:MAG: phosphoribosylamine--glycine ligase [Bacteroidales bacterium]
MMTFPNYNVLIIGSGGREHALAWKIAQSKALNKLFIAPGNAGTAQTGTNLDISETDFLSLKNAVIRLDINLIVVGPEAPLVQGIVDFFQSDSDLKDILIVGPPAAGARMEGSKDFAKEFMLRHNIPTAAYRTFSAGELSDAKMYLSTLKPPFVLKADGLAAGKGVIITTDRSEAEAELDNILIDSKFGEAGKKVLIESFLNGIELSVFVLTDGKNYLILPEAKDYKRIGEQDTGPNTGGMGSISPVPFADEAFLEKIERKIIKPTINGLIKDNIPYKGFIFFGLIKIDNEPFVIEYNARMGDPETEVVLPRINNDLLELLIAVAQGTLADHFINFDPRAAACVMMVAPGYPGTYPKGLTIKGLDKTNEVITFHAGTKLDTDSATVRSNGGRILGVTALADNLSTALGKVYTACKLIQYEGKYYRTDIGKDVLK